MRQAEKKQIRIGNIDKKNFTAGRSLVSTRLMDSPLMLKAKEKQDELFNSYYKSEAPISTIQLANNNNVSPRNKRQRDKKEESKQKRSRVENNETEQTLLRNDSFTISQKDFLSELKNKEETVSLGIKNDQTKKAVRVVKSFSDAIKLVRLFGHNVQAQQAQQAQQKQPQQKQQKQPQQKQPQQPQNEEVFDKFILEKGNFSGLFFSFWGNDLIFRILKKENGVAMRAGKVLTWSEYVEKLKLYQKKEENKTPPEIKQEIINTINDRENPKEEIIFSVAGAMSCDAKTSAYGFQKYLQEFTSSAEDKPEKLFTGEQPIWEPAQKGGRKLPDERKQKLEVEMESYDSKKNCLIHLISLQLRDKCADLDEFVYIRMRVENEQDMSVLNQKNINNIQEILKVPYKCTVSDNKDVVTCTSNNKKEQKEIRYSPNLCQTDKMINSKKCKPTAK